MFQEFSDHAKFTLKEPLEQFVAKIQAIVLGFKNSKDLNSVLLKQLKQLCQILNSEKSLEALESLLEKDLTEKSLECLDFFVSGPSGSSLAEEDHQMMGEENKTEDESFNKMDILGAIFKLLTEMGCKGA
jgi:hypothetical protein